MEQYAQAEANIATYFDSQVKHEYQSGMLLKNHVRTKNAKGGEVSFPVFGTIEASERQTGRDVTASIDNSDSRNAVIRNWNAAVYVNEETVQKTMYDDMDAAVMQITKAIGRKADDIILTAFASGLATENEVAVDVRQEGATGTGATGMNQQKLLDAHMILEAGSVSTGDRFLALTAAGAADLMADPKISSSDYNSLMPLREGKLAYYLGFNIMTIPERQVGNLPTASGTGSGKSLRTMYAWHKDAIGCAISRDIRTRVSLIDEKTSYLCNAMYDAGAVVIDRRGLVAIKSNESNFTPVSATENLL